MFRDEKDPTSELAHWKYWYNQQPNPNQRAFDIDRKACHNIDDIIEEVGCNALGFTWDPSEQAKVRANAQRRVRFLKPSHITASFLSVFMVPVIRQHIRQHISYKQDSTFSFVLTFYYLFF